MLCRLSFRGVGRQEAKPLAGFLRGSNRSSSLVKSISLVVLSNVRVVIGNKRSDILLLQKALPGSDQ